MNSLYAKALYHISPTTIHNIVCHVLNDKLRVYMYICIYIYIYVCPYTHVSVHLCGCMHVDYTQTEVCVCTYINTTYANIHIQTCHVCLVAGIFVLLCVMTRNLHGQGIIVDVLRNTADW